MNLKLSITLIKHIILFNNKEIIVDSKGLVQKRYPVNTRSLGQHQSTNVLPRIYK